LLFGVPRAQHKIDPRVKGIADDVLNWSVYQAMAGLAESEKRVKLIDLVDKIYRDHISRLNRNDDFKSTDALDKGTVSFKEGLDSRFHIEDLNKTSSKASISDLLDDFRLELIECNVNGLPEETKSTVTLARTNRGLFLRIQNADGEKVIDEYLRNLVREEESLLVLSADVSKLIDAKCSPTSEEKVSLLNRIAEILP
jgi:hypothetical protein